MLPTITLPKINTGPFDFSSKGKPTRPERPLTFASFVDLVTNGKYQWYPHCVRLAQVLQRVADGQLTRLMVFMPPRHGKSELVSRLFSAYFLYRYPGKWVGINSYAADLAYTFSRAARDNYTFAGGELSGNAYAVKHWETDEKGGLWAAGVGGPITGKGFHLGIIDDPVKNAEDASSEIKRQKDKDWFDSTFSTREEPGASIVVIQTRWHEDDLSGYILDKEADDAEAWHIVHFEGIKTDEKLKYPPTCTVEADPREIGEPLSPKRYGLEKLKKFKRRLGDYYFGALFQQRPKPREGNMFKRAWFKISDRPPGKVIKRVRYWDNAGTQDGGAFTCGVLMTLCDNDTYFLEDVVRGQWSAYERERTKLQTAQIDGRAVAIWTEQEPGSGGKESAENTIKMLKGHTARADRVTGDKVIRAEPFSAQCEAGNVYLKRAPWNRGYLERITAFPNTALKDDTDASSGAFNKLAAGVAELKAEENPFYA